MKDSEPGVAAPGRLERGDGKQARSPLEITLAYHERTKHQPFRYAASLGYMDWATQPDPFRRFTGASLLPLDLLDPGGEPRYEAVFTPGSIPPAPLDRVAVSRLFQDALALSAWKQAGTARWALRVNPSSGNLHPTEGYLVVGPVTGLHHRPAVFHYAPLEHALELRAELPAEAWEAIAAALPPGAVLVGLASIHWRESWKYGERAFRYCHHDVGHAIASVAISGAGLGWESRLLEGVTDAGLSRLLGVEGQSGEEAEHADCLIALFPPDTGFSLDGHRQFSLSDGVLDALGECRWTGVPNRLSTTHHQWSVIEDVAEATQKYSPPDPAFWSSTRSSGGQPGVRVPDVSLRRILHQRRSAVALDGRTTLARDRFYSILARVMPGPRRVPLAALPWRSCADLLLFVHRVEDLAPGLYVLLRDPDRREALEGVMSRQFAWASPDRCPASLPLFLLEPGDARRVAQQTSCDQEIAGDGVFAVAMLADYRASLEGFGPWHYRRLYWETGAIGQILYLEAEAAGIRGTGIGCFFDDLTHEAFGLEGDRFQVLYHFTMGGPVDDPRLQTLPPYHARQRAGAGYRDTDGGIAQ